MQQQSYAFVVKKTPRIFLVVVIVTVLTALGSTSLSAQTTEVPPLDVESYTTPIDAQNVDQLERLFVKLFPEYQWVGEFAMDATGNVVAVDGPNNDRSDHSIIVWNPATGDTRLFDPMDGLSLPDDDQDGDALLAVSPDGTWLAASGFLRDGRTVLRMWDIASGEVVLTEVTEDETVSSLEFSPDGAYLVAAVNGRDLAWWDVATGTKVNAISYHDYDLERTELDNPPPGSIRDVFITSDNRVYFGLGFAVFEWNLVTNQLEHMYAISFAMRIPGAPPDGRPRGIPTYQDFPPDYNIVSITVSPDERYIVTGHQAGVLIWDTQDPVWDMSFDHWDTAITSIGADEIDYSFTLQFNPAGDVLFASEQDELFAIATESWEIRARYEYPWSVISSSKLNAPGTLVFLGYVDLGLAVLAVSPEATPHTFPTATPVPLMTLEPNASGPCLIETTDETKVYVAADAERLYDIIEAGYELTPTGRLADNSWFRTDYAEAWIQASALGSTARMTGDCSELPVVIPFEYP